MPRHETAPGRGGFIRASARIYCPERLDDDGPAVLSLFLVVTPNTDSKVSAIHMGI